MSRYTPHFGLLAIEPGDDPYMDGHKFFAADRDKIDTALWLSLSGHVHDGTSGAALDAPTDAADLACSTTGGAIAAGTRLWYTYTLVDSASGQESGAAPVAVIDTPAAIDAPDSPGLAWGGTGGTLARGQYFYVLTAWTDFSTNETAALNAIGIIISGSTTTNRVIISLPDLPFGADGFNIYRRKPGGSRYLYLDSVDMNVATPPSEYVDNGSVTEDSDRSGPSRNTTNNTNSITITYPSDPVPAGYYWKIYRTTSEGAWTTSFLHSVVEETSEGSGVITVEYTDPGEQTATGQPPSSGFTYSNPEQIVLTDGAHVQGNLPMGMTSFPYSLTLTQAGTLAVTSGTLVWRCPFPSAEILWCAASLGYGSSPAATDVIVDVHLYDPEGESWQSLWTSNTNRPRVAVGQQFGVEAYPNTGLNLVQRHGALRMGILQAGGGATPTDANLTLTIYMIVTVPVMDSYTFSATSGANAALGF